MPSVKSASRRCHPFDSSSHRGGVHGPVKLHKRAERLRDLATKELRRHGVRFRLPRQANGPKNVIFFTAAANDGKACRKRCLGQLRGCRGERTRGLAQLFRLRDGWLLVRHRWGAGRLAAGASGRGPRQLEGVAQVRYVRHRVQLRQARRDLRQQNHAGPTRHPGGATVARNNPVGEPFVGYCSEHLFVREAVAGGTRGTRNYTGLSFNRGHAIAVVCL